MTRIPAVVALLVLLASRASAQPNPCTDPVPAGVVQNPGRIYATLPEQTAQLADKSGPAVTAYEVAYFLPTTTDPNVEPTVPPAQGPSTISKAAMTLFAGTTDCYGLTGMPLPVPTTGPPLLVGLRAIRAATPTQSAAVGPWSALSGPFGGAPPVPAARPLPPGRVVVKAAAVP